MTSLVIYKPVFLMLMGKGPNDIFLLYLCSVTAITEFRNTLPSQRRQTKPSFVTGYLITQICSITMATASEVANHYITSHKKKSRHFKQSFKKSLNCTLKLKAIHLTYINTALPSTLLQQHS
jgi:hypothetical protein